MRLHNVTVTPRSVTLDGLSLTVHENGPNWEHLGEGAHIVHIPVLARLVTLHGDTHNSDEPTPIYDQLIAETKARTAAHKIRRTRAQHIAAEIRKDRA